ncbi:MAG TPA: sigma-70 family RNA polymerase sigma factor [Crocinitomicaceae bacterium]|nr:sigma-70 family RNA polymerase sigma factor [Crocinitomicaceae bacterium]
MLLNKRITYRKLSDAELISFYKKKNDSLIIGELYNRYSHLVMGAAMKYIKNKHDAEDITMVVFEKLPSSILKSNIKNFKSWLYTVTKNEVFQLFRKKGIQSTELKPESENYRLNEENSLDKAHAKEKQLLQLEGLVETLKENQKKCILLFYIECKSYQEISILLKMEVNAIKSAIQNGKRNLKIKLENCEEFRSI